MSALSYYVLDVFTETRLAGNALAVVMHDGSLTAETMQSIAREMHLSETTFVERRAAEVEAEEGVRVRIFTTEEELPFAGHPTLGTASLLRAIAPECVADDTVRLALKVGAVPVRFEARAEEAPAWPVRGEMTQRDPEFGAVMDGYEVAELTGLRVEDLEAERPGQIVSTGTAFAVVPVNSAEALSRLKVKQEEATAYLRGRGARWFYVLGPDQSGLEKTRNDDGLLWRARMQFNGGEDPATGSAAGCAISYLVRHGAVASGAKVHVRQGLEMGRPSDLYLSADLVAGEAEAQGKVTNVRVGGSTILVAKGELFLS